MADSMVFPPEVEVVASGGVTWALAAGVATVSALSLAPDAGLPARKWTEIGRAPAGCVPAAVGWFPLFSASNCEPIGAVSVGSTGVLSAYARSEVAAGMLVSFTATYVAKRDS